MDSINHTVANRTTNATPTVAPTPSTTLFQVYSDASYSHAPTGTPTAAPTRAKDTRHDTEVLFLAVAVGISAVSGAVAITYGYMGRRAAAGAVRVP